ncbi:N-acetylmuramate alpha-1-phosphate uridylyltransferase MurU [Aliidiomarina soli]|uniref:Mannose-1-phosphate guanylyltransferase n=1 Tax=Aliidiomarina soli TaxID=1928574 RepID=A0A432WE11_9GAMM|nr:nucleotidyltransferase family protein [Aliidiomarina soli]RUO31048.1 mannose-1-phosphate guanylyltransferase [Aliidiomarina soli]
MRAMILAAGRGSRMRPLTDQLPKPLLTAAGTPLIDYHLHKLAKAGVTDVVINHAWLGQQLEAHIGDGSRFGVSVAWSPEPAGGLETAGGIIRALPMLGDGPFIVVNGDVWSDIDYHELPTQLGDAHGHLVLVENPAHHSEGDFALSDGRINLETTPRYTFSGVSVISPQLFAGFDEGFLKLRPVFEQAINGGLLTGRLHQGYWCDVGTPQRLAELDRYLRIDLDH